MTILLRALFVPARHARWWHCPACGVTHYADEQPGWKR